MRSTLEVAHIKIQPLVQVSCTMLLLSAGSSGSSFGLDGLWLGKNIQPGSELYRSQAPELKCKLAFHELFLTDVLHRKRIELIGA